MFDGRWGLNTLPQKLRQYLLDQPETTDDLHVVSVILKDGRVFEDVAISHCSLVAAVRGHSHVPFDAKDIAGSLDFARDGERVDLPSRQLARDSEMLFPFRKNYLLLLGLVSVFGASFS